MRWDGSITYTTYQGRTIGVNLVPYLKEILIPTLQPGDTVVMDNMRSHHAAQVEQALHDAGIELLYLPPYSPDLNPIEMLWSKLRSILRKWKCRIADDLPAYVSSALDLVLPSDCQHWFSDDHYCA